VAEVPEADSWQQRRCKGNHPDELGAGRDLAEVGWRQREPEAAAGEGRKKRCGQDEDKRQHLVWERQAASDNQVMRGETVETTTLNLGEIASTPVMAQSGISGSSTHNRTPCTLGGNKPPTLVTISGLAHLAVPPDSQ
jgi:hypothetical protein